MELPRLGAIEVREEVVVILDTGPQPFVSVVLEAASQGVRGRGLVRMAASVWGVREATDPNLSFEQGLEPPIVA